VTGNQQRAGRRAAGAWIVVTLALSAAYLGIGLQARPPRRLDAVPDVASHLGGYGVLGFAATQAAAGLAWAPGCGVGWAVAHGGLLELLQGRTATRRAEWSDLAADAAGAAIGAVLARRRAAA